MDGVCSLYEILHEAKIKKQQGVVFKIDFEKAYDKVIWEFLFVCMQKCGFSLLVCGWIKKLVTGGTFCVKINSNMRNYFGTPKGVRQGYPILPLFFNIIGDCLARMFRKAQEISLILAWCLILYRWEWLFYSMMVIPL
jgi:hypothetical protein